MGENALTPESVEPEKSVTPEPLKLVTPEAEKIELVGLRASETENTSTPENSFITQPIENFGTEKKEITEKYLDHMLFQLSSPEPKTSTPETIESNSLKTETELNAMLDNEKDSSSEDLKFPLQEYVEDLIPNLHEANTQDLMMSLSSDTPKAKTPEPATESIKIAANEPKLDICEDDVEVIELNEEDKNSVTQDGAGGAAGLKDLLS